MILNTLRFKFFFFLILFCSKNLFSLDFPEPIARPIVQEALYKDVFEQIKKQNWSMALAIVCCWVVVCTMLRLARFQHESESNNRWFHGLASPGSAVLILSLSGLIWMQPEIVTIEFLL